MTVALILFFLSVVITAAAVSALLWRRCAMTAPGRWEKTASVAVLSFLVAIVINWALSWAGMVARAPLTGFAIVLALPALVILYRVRNHDSRPQRATSLLLPLTPLIVWIAFCLWRGAVVPVLSHDALSYHLPKAVMLARAQQYDFFNAPDARISTSPPNYELLLADVLLLTGSDALTEWIGTASFVALLILGAALVERWWGDGPHVVVMLLLLASIPVILLHAGAHKNDLLSNAFYLAALLWGGRWLATQETAPLLLALGSLAAAGGTKLQAIFVAAALFIVWAWLAIRRRLRPARRQLWIIAASIPVAILLFGGWPYVVNLIDIGQVALPASSSSDAGYGDWQNLWEVPLLILLRPFDPGLADVYVPWRGERWFWPRYEFYFSDYGILLSLLTLAVPFTVRRYRNRWGTDPVLRERVYTSSAAAIALLLMLPLRIRPLGFFAGYPRYFAFIAACVLAWTAAPMVRELWERRNIFMVQLVTASSALILITTAAAHTVHDRFQPLDYVLYAAEHPGLREPYFSRYRSGTVADLIAGPTDTIAVHSGFDSWIYPLYGASLQRKVVFVEPGQPIPSDAKFVVVDRSWSVNWGHPDFEHMGQYRRYLGRGKPAAEDLAVVRAVAADPRYELLHAIPSHIQAVFRRRDLPQPATSAAATRSPE